MYTSKLPGEGEGSFQKTKPLARGTAKMLRVSISSFPLVILNEHSLNCKGTNQSNNQSINNGKLIIINRRSWVRFAITTLRSRAINVSGKNTIPRFVDRCDKHDSGLVQLA